MIKEKISSYLLPAVISACSEAGIVLDDEGCRQLARLEKIRDPRHGDYFSRCALHLMKMPPQIPAMKIGAGIISHLDLHAEAGTYIATADLCDPGFINFTLREAALAQVPREIARQAGEYGFLKKNIAVTAEAPPDPFVYQTYLYCRTILRLARAERINILAGRLESPILSADDWMIFLAQMRDLDEIFLDVFSDSGVRARRLIMRLDAYPEIAGRAAQADQSRLLRDYALDLSKDLQAFCGRFNLGEGFFAAQLSVLKARLGLIFATGQVLSNVMGIIDLTAPEKM